MAGSIKHITDADGNFTMDLIENLGDAREALEECFNEIMHLRDRSAPAAHRILTGLMEGTMPPVPLPGNCEPENMGPVLDWLKQQMDADDGGCPDGEETKKEE